MSRIKKLQSAALGNIPCSLVIKNVTYLDVFSCEWRKGDIGILDETIVSLDTGIKGLREIDASGKWLVPGFIDAHVHIESSLVLPQNFQKSVLPLGTTTAVCDPHELTNVMGAQALDYFLKQASNLHLDLRVMLSSCVPATHLETNGGGVVKAQDLAPFISHPKALGLAEVMNVPGVLSGDEVVHDKLELFQNRPIDGHCPLLHGRELSAYAIAGISSCHESSQLEEAREKLTKGIAVWIREGSVAKDLEALVPLLNLGSSMSIGFCTDDRNPLDISAEGHLDYLVKEAIRKGVDLKVAYRAASYSVASHYGLHTGRDRVGAIAPGFRADLVLLGDAHTCAIDAVLKSGAWVSELDLDFTSAEDLRNTVHAEMVHASDLEAPEGLVNVIRVLPGKIITEHEVALHTAEGVAKLSVVERHGQKNKPANAYVSGFGNQFTGAIASSVGHDSHNLIAVGSSASDMAIAFNALRDMKGGFCVVKNAEVISKLELPFGGLMSNQSSKSVEASLIDLRKASRSIGCVLDEPFLQLAFLSLPVIPKLKLTDLGLVDVELFKFIDVRAS